MAQSQSEVRVLQGNVTEELGPNFASWLAVHGDQVVGLRVRIQPTLRGDGAYSVFGDPSQSRISVSSVDREQGIGVEINADAVWSNGAWLLNGFFVPKYVGMYQGTMAIFLEPVDEAAVRLSPARLITTQTDSIPPEELKDE